MAKSNIPDDLVDVDAPSDLVDVDAPSDLQDVGPGPGIMQRMMPMLEQGLATGMGAARGAGSLIGKAFLGPHVVDGLGKQIPGAKSLEKKKEGLVVEGVRNLMDAGVPTPIAGTMGAITNIMGSVPQTGGEALLLAAPFIGKAIGKISGAAKKADKISDIVGPLPSEVRISAAERKHLTELSEKSKEIQLQSKIDDLQQNINAFQETVGNQTNKLGQEKQKLTRSLQQQRQAFNALTARGEVSTGAKRQMASMLRGIETTKQKLNAVNQQFLAARTRGGVAPSEFPTQDVISMQQEMASLQTEKKALIDARNQTEWLEKELTNAKTRESVLTEKPIVAPATPATQAKPKLKPAIKSDSPPPEMQPPVINTPDGPMQNPIPAVKQAVLGTEETVNELKRRIPELDGKLKYLRGKQTTDQVIDLVDQDLITPDEAAKLFGLEGLANEGKAQLMIRLRQSSTLFGQGLNRWSQAAEALAKLSKDSGFGKELAALASNDNYNIVGRALREGYGMTRDLTALWRSFLTSQLGTTKRHVLSQGIYTGAHIVDTALEGIVLTALKGGNIKPSVAFAEPIQNVMAWSRMLFSRGNRNKLEKILDQFPIEKAAMSGHPLSDLATSGHSILGKVTIPVGRAINILNTFQEQFFRRLAFDARLRTTLQKVGVGIDDFNKLDPKQARDIVHDAAQHTLELTFALNPDRGTAARRILDGYNAIPFIHVMGNPFPRFWYNAIRFVMNHSPVGLMYAATASSKEAAARSTGKALTGIMTFSAALAMRGGESAGTKWYLIKPNKDKPDRTIDVRNFAPYSANVFLADLVKRVMEWKIDDPVLGPKIKYAADGLGMKLNKRYDIGYGADELANALLALRRTDFAGIPFLDNFVFNKNEITENTDKMQNTLVKMIGDFLGGFGVPIKSVRDIQSGLEAQEVKSTQQSPLTSSFLDAIPGVREKLPGEPSPFRRGNRQREEPRLRQFPGVSVQKHTEVERELYGLDLRETQYTIKTGNADLDDLHARIMGALVEKAIGNMVKKEEYKSLAIDRKKFITKYILKELGMQALEAAKGLRPDLSIPIDIRNIASRGAPSGTGDLRESKLLRDRASALEKNQNQGRLP